MMSTLLNLGASGGEIAWMVVAGTIFIAVTVLAARGAWRRGNTARWSKESRSRAGQSGTGTDPGFLAGAMLWSGTNRHTEESGGGNDVGSDGGGSDGGGGDGGGGCGGGD